MSLWPLATVQNAVLEFLRDRDDAVVFDAQAVNAYVPEARMTQDLDLLSTRAADLADELGDHLSRQFDIEVRVQQIGGDRGYPVSDFASRAIATLSTSGLSIAYHPQNEWREC
jgi:hypothetical protein